MRPGEGSSFGHAHALSQRSSHGCCRTRTRTRTRTTTCRHLLVKHPRAEPLGICILPHLLGMCARAWRKRRCKRLLIRAVLAVHVVVVVATAAAAPSATTDQPAGIRRFLYIGCKDLVVRVLLHVHRADGPYHLDRRWFELLHISAKAHPRRVSVPNLPGLAKETSGRVPHLLYSSTCNGLGSMRRVASVLDASQLPRGACPYVCPACTTDTPC
ncbi:hypothetical protein BC831DRAFT_453685, partial [Entophlyctis helioformis]